MARRRSLLAWLRYAGHPARASREDELDAHRATVFVIVAAAVAAGCGSTASTSPSRSSSSLGGLMQQVAWWHARYRSIAPNQCTAAGESTPIGTEYAWQFSSNAIACFTILGAVWREHVINLDLFFTRPVTEQQATTLAATVLPPDAVRGHTFDGVNADYSAIRNGSCRQTVYTSDSLRGRVIAVNPGWKDDPSKATIDLYSGNATSANGAEKPYDSSHLHLAMVGIGSENRGADGIVHC